MAERRAGEREGVVQYRAEHREEDLDRGLAPLAAALAAWRRPLRALGWLGQDPARYGGYGFGNLSARVPADLPAAASGGEPAPGGRPFLVTGSQTGGAERLDLDGFALVERWDAPAHRLWSRGRAAASSESLTHAALYDASPKVGAVFHVHAPEVWHRRDDLGMPETDPAVPYGTPEMAVEVGRAWRRWAAGRSKKERGGGGLLAMGGHEDGLLAWGPAPDRTGQVLLDALLGIVP